MHADRTNRFALTVFALVLLLAGVFGIVASTGGFGKSYTHRTLFANQVSSYVGKHGSWLWWAVAGVCVVIALLALRWMLALLLTTDRVSDINVIRKGQHGATVLHSSALTAAVSREIETYHGAESARARVLGDSGDPSLVVTVTAARSADLAALRARIEAEALSHARSALGKPDLPIQLDLEVSNRTAERVGASDR